MPRFRLRLSLLTALLLTTIIAMAIAITLLWREVAPLRQEVQRLRMETGYLTLDDPTKVHVISVPTFEEDTWKWRIYLPPGGTYTLHERSGRLPPRSMHPGDDWFDALITDGSGSSSSGSSWRGEFTLEARLIKDGNDWVLATQHKSTDGDFAASGGTRSSIYQPSEDWLSDRRLRWTTSNIHATQQSSFVPGEPILLLHMKKATITETPGGGYTKTMTDDVADGFALWIE